MADLEQNQPLLQAQPQPQAQTQPQAQPKQHRPNNAVFAALVSFGTLLLLSLAALTLDGGANGGGHGGVSPAAAVSRGKKEGVSEKVFQAAGGKYYETFAWTNEMLQWQRTGFHFQPQKNWMNDPNGPLYHKGYYHLFYQYNPDSAVWGNITWGHAVSTDLIHWKYLPISMVPDHWYDINGVWSGSATILPNGTIVMLYTGSTAQSVQVQNLAHPANLSDPLLLDWVKYSGNPVLTPPQGIGKKDFRDPTTAWVGSDGVWRITIGSRDGEGTGFSLVYKTKDFVSYELVDHRLHQVPGTGMWECVDFFPVSTQSENGLDTSAYGPGIKHFLKASLDDVKIDYYALGTYDMANETWKPDNPELDVGIGLKLDYGGKYYASKTFYDPVKGRRILWGWMGETDSEDADLLKGWASVQTIPRVVTYDRKTQTNIIQWPVEELESLRSESIEFENVVVKPGSIVNLDLTSAAQLDISAEFTVDLKALKTVGDDVINNCSAAAKRQALGPFGLLVLADKSLSEFTPVYFHIAKASDGTVRNWFCTDLSRSSLGSGVDKQVHGGPVPVLEGEKYSMRLLVDHSIVEGFGQGGRTCTTTRIYPTKAINGAARVFLFNNATDVSVTASVKIWRLKSAEIGPF